MKTVLVTGGSGFIFSHFCEMLLRENYKVVNIDKLTYAATPNFHPSSPNYRLINEDIKDVKELPYCDYIVHAASESHVDRSIANSDPFIDSNIIGTYNILELLKNKKIEHMESGWEYRDPILVYISTDEVLGDIDKGFFRECDSLNPSNPYSGSKASAEMLVKAWGRTYNIPYKITRTTNNYGPRQHEEKLIPHVITQLLKNEKVKVHGDGSYVRNWIHCLDNCDAVLKVMEKGKIGEIYNISSDEEYSVCEIVEVVAEKFGKKFDDVVDFIPNRVGGDIRYGLDNSKIKKELGWNQKYNLKNSLDSIIDSYKISSRAL